jgi:hypothetical protein
MVSKLAVGTHNNAITTALWIERRQGDGSQRILNWCCRANSPMRSAADNSTISKKRENKNRFAKVVIPHRK